MLSGSLFPIEKEMPINIYDIPPWITLLLRSDSLLSESMSSLYRQEFNRWTYINCGIPHLASYHVVTGGSFFLFNSRP
jgi:hypothetical protein